MKNGTLLCVRLVLLLFVISAVIEHAEGFLPTQMHPHGRVSTTVGRFLVQRQPRRHYQHHRSSSRVRRLLVHDYQHRVASWSSLLLWPSFFIATDASTTSITEAVVRVAPLPVLYSLLAGLSTCLGAAVVFLVPDLTATFSNDSNTEQPRPNRSSSSIMAFALSLAGAVMITVSVVSLLPEAFTVSSHWDESLFSLGLGSALFWVLAASQWAFPELTFPEPDEILLSYQQRQEGRGEEIHDDNVKQSLAIIPNKEKAAAVAAEEQEQRRAWRLAVLLFVSLLCHNFPEGCAVAASTLVSPHHRGVSTAVAIALHNVPEGIAIAVPALRARPEEPWTAFGMASLSGLAEPVGAVVTLAVIHGNAGAAGRMDLAADAATSLNHDILAFVAGIMITVAIRELFPEAMRHSKDGDQSSLICGTLMGIMVMLATEMYLEA